MKRFILIIAVLFSISSNAQLYLGAAPGFSSKGKLVAELQVGGVFNQHTIMQVGFQAHVDAVNPCIMQAKIGHRFSIGDFTGIQVSGGYAFHFVSNDNKSRNKNSYIATAEFYKELGIGEYFIGATYTPGYFIATIGIRGFIGN